VFKINKLLAVPVVAIVVLVMALAVGTVYGSPAPTATPTPTPASTPIATPTLVVAAHDSLHPEGADFVCDGVNDQVEIQIAIDALEASGGGRLLFIEGNYYLSPQGEYCVTLASDVTLEGQGEVCLSLVGEPERGMFITKDWRWNHPYVKVKNISIVNLTIDVGSPLGFWRDSEWSEFWDFFVLCGSIDSFQLKNVRFISNNPSYVVSRLFLWQCHDVEIVGCSFDGVAVWAFSHTDPADPTSISGEHCLVKECTFVNTPIDHFAVGGNMIGFTVIDSEFSSCGSTAIDVGISPNAVIMRNKISDGKRFGIYSEGAYNVTIKNNVIENIASEGHWGGFGIGTADYLHMRVGGDVVIEDNIIANVGCGICVLGVPDVTIRNNEITAAERHGIYLGVVAEGGKYYDGIPSYADECKVINNRIIEFGRDYPWARGVMLTNARYCEIEDNVIDGCNNQGAVQGIGEYQHPQLSEHWPDRNTIENNTIAGVGTAIRPVGPNSVVQGNEVQ